MVQRRTSRWNREHLAICGPPSPTQSTQAAESHLQIQQQRGIGLCSAGACLRYRARVLGWDEVMGDTSIDRLA
jgi:hypothetical protein